MARTLYISKKRANDNLLGLGNFPNFHASGSIAGMKKMYYGKDALFVRCGSYVYNVDSDTYNKVLFINKYRRV